MEDINKDIELEELKNTENSEQKENDKEIENKEATEATEVEELEATEIIEPENQKEELEDEEQQEEGETKKFYKRKRNKKDKVAEELGVKLQEINDKYLRLSAEFDNYRKRTLKERIELTKTASEGVLQGLLPVMDDFDRAFKAITDAKEIDAVKEGFDLIYNKMKDFLIQKGVKEIDAKGDEFDTDLHEAIVKMPVPQDNLKGKVIDEVEKGYMLNEKVIRFSKVVIGE